MTWTPADHDFHEDDTIQQRVVVHAGGVGPATFELGSVVFSPWWERLWHENRSAIIAVGAPFGVFFLYACGFLMVFLVAPARLATVGSASLDGIAPPTGNIAFFWSLLRKLWDGVLLRWLCRNGRVRRAWVRDYENGRSKLGDLGKFARESFVKEPDVLDTWVTARLPRVSAALDALDLYAQRRAYVPLPVRMGSQVVERPNAAVLAKPSHGTGPLSG